MRSSGTSSTATILARSPSSRAASIICARQPRSCCTSTSGKQQRERLVADQFARAPDRVAEPERLLLAGEAGRAGLGQIVAQHIERLLLLPLEQRHFQLELAVEMILDDALVAAGDEDEMLDAGLAGLVDHVLDQRPVDHRQHLLRHGLGGRQEPGAEPGDGKHSFANFDVIGCRWEGRQIE